MEYNALSLKLLDNATIEMTFIDGKIIRFKMSQLYEKYPQYKALENKDLFYKGYLEPDGSGVYWNDQLDIAANHVYYDGEVIGQEEISLSRKLAREILKARIERNMTQVELGKIAHINQGDICRIEKGLANPSLKTIERIAKALNVKVELLFELDS